MVTWGKTIAQNDNQNIDLDKITNLIQNSPALPVFISLCVCAWIELCAILT